MGGFFGVRARRPAFGRRCLSPRVAAGVCLWLQVDGDRCLGHTRLRGGASLLRSAPGRQALFACPVASAEASAQKGETPREGRPPLALGVERGTALLPESRRPWEQRDWWGLVMIDRGTFYDYKADECW